MHWNHEGRHHDRSIPINTTPLSLLKRMSTSRPIIHHQYDRSSIRSGIVVKGGDDLGFLPVLWFVDPLPSFESMSSSSVIDRWTSIGRKKKDQNRGKWKHWKMVVTFLECCYNALSAGRWVVHDLLAKNNQSRSRTYLDSSFGLCFILSPQNRRSGPWNLKGFVLVCYLIHFSLSPWPPRRFSLYCLLVLRLVQACTTFTSVTWYSPSSQ